MIFLNFFYLVVSARWQYKILKLFNSFLITDRKKKSFRCLLHENIQTAANNLIFSENNS